MNSPSLARGDALSDRIIDRHPLIASPETSVREAILRMEQAGAEGIFVVEPDPAGVSRFLGLFSDRDLLPLAAAGADLSHCCLQSAMQQGAIAIAESQVQDIASILTLFRLHRLHLLPVVGDRGELVGAIATHDLLEEIERETKQELERQRSEHQLLQQQIRTSEAKMRALIESINDIVLVVEAGGTQLEVMPTHPALQCDPEMDLIGRTIAQFFQDPTADRFFQPVREALTNGERLNFEYSFAIVDTELWFDACISPLSERSVLWIARDITQRKRAEVEVFKALEQERELNDLKSHFVSMTSHEFRTPLSVIKSSAQLLQRYDWSRQDQLQHLQQIQSAVQHMTLLLEDILTLAQAEAGKLEFNPAPLELIDFCRRLVSQIQLAPGARHSLNFTCAIARDELNVRMDEKLLQQILSNLLSNAIKYSPSDRVVRLALELDPSWRESGGIVFQVRDSGRGIPSEARSHLFESFYRASNVGSIPGTGLGLTIVKQCVELHQGTIYWESQLGVGTTFRVTLPLLS
jgi:PAS domain S-box-containing protein